ncbi:MAG: hypothetical protein KA801_09330 [Syntrophorhabdaceae bacterium]|nr:hypothetical protein [Syntrophorhabdaceae bacterium]
MDKKIGFTQDTLETKEKKICNSCGFRTIHKFPYCPKCGKPSIAWQRHINKLFNMLPVSPKLRKSIQLFEQGQYESSARTALVILEEVIRETAKIDSYGVGLISQAFSFKYDLQTNSITVFPPIMINDLKSEEDRNEHEGIKLMLLGVMRGIRNIIAHHSKDFLPKECLQILMTCDFLVNIVTNGSLLKERICIWTRVST